MTLYGYARVSVREPEDKNLDLQVERLVRAGCAMGNIRAEEASGAKDDRGGLLELLDLVVEGDALVVTHIDRLSRECRQFKNIGLQASVSVIPAKAGTRNPVAGKYAFAANGPCIPAKAGMTVNMTTLPSITTTVYLAG